MKKRVAIIGGTQKNTFEQFAKKNGFDLLFHDGKLKGGGNKKLFSTLVKKADAVIVMYGACCHPSSELAKELCKKANKPIGFHKGRGASGAFSLAESLLHGLQPAWIWMEGLKYSLRETTRDIRLEIHDTLDEHCRRCTKYKDNVKVSVSEASNYCLFLCPIGQDLQQLGNKLLDCALVEKLVFSL